MPLKLHKISGFDKRRQVIATAYPAGRYAFHLHVGNRAKPLRVRSYSGVLAAMAAAGARWVETQHVAEA